MEQIASRNSSAQLSEQRELLAELVSNLPFEHHPELLLKSGTAGKSRCKEDCLVHLSYLTEAVRFQRSELFTGYLQWTKVMLQSRNIPVEELAGNLRYLDVACRQVLSPGHYKVVSAYIAQGVDCLNTFTTHTTSFLTAENPLQPYAIEYLSLLLKSDRKQAQSLIQNLLLSGHQIGTIYEYIFEATQYEVGLLWQTNKITVAREHYCTAATQFIMSTIYPHIFNTKRRGFKMIGCTLEGGLHELGIRMVSDFFEMEGWDTCYLGAHMPVTNIIRAVKEQQAHLLALSITMPNHITKLETLIQKIKGDETLVTLKIIVGGLPFIQYPGLWKCVGADGWAKNAREAVMLGTEMILHKNKPYEQTYPG